MGTSLVAQWLRLCTSTEGGAGSIPGGETKIPHAMWHGQKKKKQVVQQHVPMNPVCMGLQVFKVEYMLLHA